MTEIAVLSVRYDGLDAEMHVLDASALGESMQGVSRILSTLAHFAVTGEYVKQQPAMAVRLVARPPRENCFTWDAVLQFAQQHGLFQGSIGVVVAAALPLVIARAANRHSEMKHLRQSLEQALQLMAEGNAATVERLSQTIEAMAAGLRPAVQHAVAPVGRNCAQMSLGNLASVDIPTAEAIRAEALESVSDEGEHLIRITELDLENRTAKVRLDGLDDARFPADITDPALRVPGNPYLDAFTHQRELRVRGKLALRDGSISRLFISDYV